MKINLNEIIINPDLDSIVREKISDEEYFSDRYSHYTSNSRLKLIDPDKNGSPSKYQKGFKTGYDPSLALGSVVHQCVLQPDEFSLGPDLNKPSAKLGAVIDKIKEYRKHDKIIDALNKACTTIDYYKDKLNRNRLRKIINEGLGYYLNIPKDNSILILSNKDRQICEHCIDNLFKNRSIYNLLFPTDVFGYPIESYTEDAFFMDFICKHQDKECRIKFKMKADHWSIDFDNKIITLNDLKTTSKPVHEFLSGSFVHFSYYTQFAIYLYILLAYCKKQYGYNKEEWRYDCNVLVVGTRGNNDTAVYKVFDEFIKAGKKEFCKLLKMVAYCEMYGYDDDYMFM